MTESSLNSRPEPSSTDAVPANRLAGRLAACALALAGATLFAPHALAAPPAWHHTLEWRGQVARVAVVPGGYVLQSPAAVRTIHRQRFRVRTASPLFDALFAMAQSDLKKDSVSAIEDPAFKHGHPIACRCFIAGKDWPFAWTRDLSYSTDLGLWRFDPARARASLSFKVSPVRAAGVPPGEYVMQDTGSGGSWPISTDRVVWFLGARHLLDDRRFASKVFQALTDTLAQDRRYAFDPSAGLYRGETSFLDWRQQTYPAWTAHDVVFIAQSFSLSTNVLHYEALRLAATLSKQHGRILAARRYLEQAAALKRAINLRFWRPGRGLYMSYIGGQVAPAPFDTYDLLGLDLAIVSGVADRARAERVLASYPIWPAGSPVIWPERRDQPIYHNSSIWPFVSEYTLRAARRIEDAALIASEIRSLMRGPALNASNMENYSLLEQSTHVPGKLGGPVVDSPRQLWSVAGYLDMVLRGVFGLRDDGSVHPELPVSLVPMLFGSGRSIALDFGARRIVLRRPARLTGNLLVAGAVRGQGGLTEVQLIATRATEPPPPAHAPMYLPQTPAAPKVVAAGSDWRIGSQVRRGLLYLNGRRLGPISAHQRMAKREGLHCFSVTERARSGLESLHSPETCVGLEQSVAGPWPRHWTASRPGVYMAWLTYDNPHGPISTGITAAVRLMAVHCAGSAPRKAPVVMPQSHGDEASTVVRFRARAGAQCRFALAGGFNMSDLAHFAYYTGGQGGATGPLNSARIGELHIAPLSGDPP